MQKNFFLLLALLFLATQSHAQKTPEQLGGVYYAYPAPPTSYLAPRTSYLEPSTSHLSPFYISHYGRHGSRWLPNDDRYEWVLRCFSDTKNLTSLGKSVRRRLQKVWKNARGNGGKLTPLGARQHQGIAQRMVERFPEVFAGDDTRIWARSSTVDRCRKSMLAFTDKLRSLLPSSPDTHQPIPIDVATREEDMAWMVNNTPEVKALEYRTRVVAQLSPDRFMQSLFKDPSLVLAEEGSPLSEEHKKAVRLMSELFTIATDMQDVELNINLFDIFTYEEMQAIYEANNKRMTLCNGNLPQSEGIPARAAITLWQNIEHDADAMIAAGGHGAALRFGHDTNLYRLLSLLQTSSISLTSHLSPLTSYNQMDEILPMAANLQMVFYKKEGENPTDTTAFVLFLHNEKPVRLSSLTSLGEDPLYRWSDVKDYVMNRIHRLEHLQQLNALNTMVGTAQANTQSAGLFGKGSEEHGQTLPAVLAPNGQNFWTPQTQDTEKKCIAPYYYRDSLFQGFRNSHWIVGGCTQDYGSFTVAAISGSLRTSPAARATRFSHDDEVSHPHYYRVHLPDEHLTAELTGSSHTAMIRVTPHRLSPRPPYKGGSDNPLQSENQAERDSTPLHDREGQGESLFIHIVINPNSDEGQGHIEVDTLRHIVYGYNPVHRIYQGWGEPAGFSGHFLLNYGMHELIDFGTYEGDRTFSHNTEIRQQPSHSVPPYPRTSVPPHPIGIYLTFRVSKDTPLILTAASSFSSREGCLNNLESEAAGKTFEQMQSDLADQWIDRLHTIDVEDPDTTRVNQFYGALYRASFLPREFSDASSSPLGSAAFRATAGKELAPRTSYLEKYFTDFSMWDTYRAVHPLYNIIAPTLSAQMMQSLVTFAEKGGWMPIFPCWNSYTAAMIGDHCASVLADAYVKGIGRDTSHLAPRTSYLDYAKAYQYLRQNAFDSPTEAEYKNGMGRRALPSYLKYGYIPLEDKVPDAFHTEEQTSRTLEYAYDDFCVAQLARDFGTAGDYNELKRRSSNWQNVINPLTGWADGRHADGSWEGNTDLMHRKSYITEGATCHYSFYVPHDIPALINTMGGPKRFEAKLDSLFSKGLYWHGNEPCHQIAYLYNYVGRNDKTRSVVRHILDTEYNDTPGGLSGNDDAGQMSAWYIFSSIGLYPVCPGTPDYQLAAPTFQRVTFNLENGRQFTIERPSPQPLPASEGSSYSHGTEVQLENDSTPLLNREGLGGGSSITHSQILQGGTIKF